MTLEEKDKYIAEHLMAMKPDTLRFMVADLTSEVERLTAALVGVAEMGCIGATSSGPCGDCPVCDAEKALKDPAEAVRP